ncbi:MarR family winged helix-turn-helix transcriptional regulator [Gracilimonas mengyeensis]|uniref:DNA-binding transcriptional regulator, MarR family n=1 Tax=Gracilimonas mengyeensis TaxID=1302730 RepID=A0A521E4R1_9BACT|nr:MarR family transcriptional regulator [Gracilimonas mengyeensis]SMO78865.1 DNA-binding transcriptional regulator, MarR family [Gracilimonas mengyeensis]
MSTATATATDQNIWQELRDNICETEVWLRTTLKDFLEEYGITQQQFNILRILRDANNEPMSTKEIKAKMIDKNSDASRLVDRLVDKELVRKRQSPEDGRLIQVFINYEGIKLLAKIDDKLHELDDQFELLSEDEAEQLNALLEKVRV